MTKRVMRWLAALLAVATLAVALTGCWDDVTLDRRTLVLDMGFYPGQQPGTLKVYFGFPTPTGLTSSNGAGSGGGGGSAPQFSDVTGTGYSLPQAFSQAQSKSGRDLYLGHTVLLVFSTKLSPLQFKLLENAINRIGTLDKTPFVAATADPWDKVVAVKMDQEEFPALYYEELFSCPRCTQFALGTRLWEMGTRLARPGVDLVLPQLSLSAEGPKLDQVALYRNYRYVGTWDHAQTTDYALAAGRSRKSSLVFPDHGHAAFDSVADKMQLRTALRGRQVDAMVNLHVTATLVTLDTSKENAKQLSVLSRASSQQIAERVLKILELSQKRDVDVLGVGRELAWNDPTAFAEFKHWHQEYPHVHWTVHCQVIINKMGDLK